MLSLAPHHERKTRKDYGTKRGRPFISTSSSSVFAYLSSSHPIDDDNDANDEGTSHASTHTPTLFVSSLTNERVKVNQEGHQELVERKEEISYLDNG
ncbi:hypothetical protein Tco_0455961 [Tanacetum coccineum]